jgi:hypothetical protein
MGARLMPKILCGSWFRTAGGIVCFVFFGALLANCSRGFTPVMRDSDLETRLKQKRALFSQLANMAMADSKLARIAPDFYKTECIGGNPIWAPSGALPEQRWDRYRSLFRDLGLKHGIMRLPESPEIILLMPRGEDPEEHLESKGYAYSEGRIEPLFSSLDRPPALKDGRIAFKRVVDNWYIYCLFVR